MKFEVGDVVVISNPSTLYTEQFRGQRAAITAYHENEIFQYEVTFPNGQILGFDESEISVVHRAPTWK
ncbi:hypothetical protein ACR6C2_16680 [Streptomyces sp. INA 01156]